MVKLSLLIVGLFGIQGFNAAAFTNSTLKDGQVYISDNVEIAAKDLLVHKEPIFDPEDYNTNVSQNSRLGTDPLTGGFLGLIKDLFTPTIVQDLYKLFVHTPPKKLTKQRIFKHGTVEEVKKYLALSLISFCTKDKVLNQQCGCQKTLTNLSVIENKEFDSMTIVGVDTVNKLIVVSYRASLTFQNWVINFSYPKVDFPYLTEGIKVHHGFLSHYLSTYHEVHNAVKELLTKPQFKGYTLHITGYSLGAAISTLSLPNWSQLLKELNDNRPIVNFAYASPRIGNDNFVQYLHSLNIPITRYTNVNDIVPHLPPRSGDFVHAGGEVHERKTGILGATELVVCGQGTYDENPECSWKDKNPISVLRHVLPMKSLPVSTFCI